MSHSQTIATAANDSFGLEYDHFEGASAAQVAIAIATMIQPFGLVGDQALNFTADVTDILNGSAIEVAHTVGGHKIEVDITDNDDVRIAIDGEVVGQYDISGVELLA